jgi:hypothetical protein
METSVINKEYRLIINEAQRRILLSAVSSALENSRRSTEGILSQPTEREYWELIVRLSTLSPFR